jgi:hypothetical protein
LGIMAGQTKKTDKSKKEGAGIDILRELDRSQVLTILHKLAKKDPALLKTIVRHARTLLKVEIEPEEIARQLYTQLNAISIDDFYAEYHARTFRHYEDISEVADDVLREAFYPFTEEIEKYRRVGQEKEEFSCLAGTVLGLYRFDMQPGTDFYDYVQDSLYEFAQESIQDWVMAHSEDLEQQTALQDYLNEHCPNWELPVRQQ